MYRKLLEIFNAWNISGNSRYEGNVFPRFEISGKYDPEDIWNCNEFCLLNNKAPSRTISETQVSG